MQPVRATLSIIMLPFFGPVQTLQSDCVNYVCVCVYLSAGRVTGNLTANVYAWERFIAEPRCTYAWRNHDPVGS